MRPDCPSDATVVRAGRLALVCGTNEGPSATAYPDGLVLDLDATRTCRMTDAADQVGSTSVQSSNGGPVAMDTIT